LGNLHRLRKIGDARSASLHLPPNHSSPARRAGVRADRAGEKWEHHITGLIISSDTFYLRLVEGPREEINQHQFILDNDVIK